MSKQNQPARIQDIAAIANVSVTTVSMVLNGNAQRYRIGKKTQEKIEKIAAELSYSPNPSARSLRNKTTQTIGLVISHLNNHFFTQLAGQLEQICRTNGYLLQISASEDDEVLEKELIQNFISKSVDGLIIASVQKDSEHLIERVQGIPTVFIDREIEGDAQGWVGSNNQQSTDDLVTRLISKAGEPREAAYIGGIKHLSSSKARLSGFKQALKRANIPFERKVVIEEDYSIAAGNRSMQKLVQQLGRAPDVLFTASFTLLEGALPVLRQALDSNPKTRSVIGTFDDHPLLDFVTPTIHSVRQDYSEIALSAFAQLKARFDGQSNVPAVVVPATLVIR